MLDFTQTLMCTRMNLTPASQNHRKWPKTSENTNGSWKLYIYVIRCLMVNLQVKSLERNSKQAAFITFDSFLTPRPKSSQLAVFSVSRFVSLILNPCTLFLQFKKRLVISLQKFATQQQTCTLERQKHSWFY